MAVHENLQALIKQLNISQRQFAQTLRLDPGYLSRIIAGKTPLIPRIQLLIENTFNVSDDWLTTGEGNMFRAQNCSAAKTKVLLALDSLDEDQLALVDSFISYIKNRADLPPV